MTMCKTIYIDPAVWEFSNVGIKAVWECSSMPDLTVLFGQLCIVQLSRKVNQEAASVAVYPPLGCADRVQHQGSIVTLRAGGHPLPNHAVLALGVGAQRAGHAALACRPL